MANFKHIKPFNENSVEQYRQWLEDQKTAGFVDDSDVEIITEKFAEDRNNSFWYEGDQIAKINLKDGGYLIAESEGEIRVQFEEDGVHYRGSNAVAEAWDRGYNDEDLLKINDFEGWDTDSWIAINGKDSDNNLIDDEFELCATYDEAIESLKNLKTWIDNGEL